MATFRQLIYAVLDEVKSINGDSFITEDYVLFLLNQYRAYILQQKIDKQGESSISELNYQTFTVKMLVDCIEKCSDWKYLKSELKIPYTLGNKIPLIYPVRYFNTSMVHVPKNRLLYVGYNKFLKNITYCSIHDGYLYIKVTNPLVLYLELVNISGLFNNAQEVAEIINSYSEDGCADFMDSQYPMSEDLIPLLLEAVIKQVSLVLIRPEDRYNNSSDDMAKAPVTKQNTKQAEQ